MKRYGLALLALIGICIVVAAIFLDHSSKPTTRPPAMSPPAPFSDYIAGAGIVEAGGGNIAVGTPVGGIVTAVYAKWGEHVKAQEKLFKIDDRDLLARLMPAQARVNEADAKLKQAKNQLHLAESVPDKRAISVEEINNRRSAAAIAGTSLAVAKAQVEQIRLDIERCTVRALAPGKILQINVHPGEFAPSGATAKPLILLGNDERLYLRVDIDEYDAWRVSPGAPGVAFIRGRPDLKIPLKFERIEPYVTPKTSLTGAGPERVDTRVLQVIYSFEPSAFPVYAGQQMDVYIQVPAHGSAK